MVKSLPVMLIYIISHLGIIFFLYPGNIIASTNQGHWAPILIGIVFHFVLILIYMKGLSFFPNKDVISIYSGIGKITTFLFLTPTLIYFIMVIIIAVRAYAEIINIVFLSHTPIWAIMILLLSTITYMAAKGIEVIFRTGLLLAFLFLPIILFILILSFQNVDWRYAIPIDSDFRFITKPVFFQSFSAFAGGFLFLGFVQPYFSYEKKGVLLAAGILIPCFILSVYIPILTFGQSTASPLFLPFVVVLDSTKITWLMFERVTMFFLLSLITFVIVYTSLTTWKTIRIINHYIPSIKPVFLLVSFSGLVFFTGLLIPDWKDVEKLLWWNTFFRFYSYIAIPLSLCFFGLRLVRKGKNETI
ncbi:GerAB/ArcD/ProY family transporter [Neobacillus sp. MM2021_6]|nr:GerAB/ArcD/ProY family transporter [Neobacillus sp. MM2021_6]NHC20976.1 GerAB/ArcD/ProY family transporter [Bacillus sp. MM2020_4]